MGNKEDKEEKNKILFIFIGLAAAICFKLVCRFPFLGGEEDEGHFCSKFG